MKVTDYILKAFQTEGVDTVFLVPGGLIDPFLLAFGRVEEVRPIVAAQEGGAAYMADGYSRASGRFGACLAIGGPGIGNMTTPLMGAFSDESPLFVVSGEVPSKAEGLSQFQDASLAALDDFDIIKGVTRSSLYVEHEVLFSGKFRKLMAQMLGGRQGPVHLNLPKDIQDAEIEGSYEKLPEGVIEAWYVQEAAMTSAVRRLSGSNGKVAFYVGSGAVAVACHDELLAVATLYGIPVATTQKAKGMIPEDHHLSLGCFGYAGTQHAMEAFLGSEIDLIVVIGSGLNERDAMAQSPSFTPKEGFIHVDLDFEHLIRFPKGDLIVKGDCRTFLQRLLERGEQLKGLNETAARRAEWLKGIREKSRFYDSENRKSSERPIHPARVVADLRAAMPRDTVLLVDSGAHRAFTVHYWEAYGPKQFLSAANLGPMGWAIPAAVGAALAKPNRPHVVVTGDGCMLMHGMEIQTAGRYGLPIIYVVINNSALANVYLRARDEGTMPRELTSLPEHDWAAFARSLGVEGVRVEDPAQLETVFQQALHSEKTVLIDIKCSKEAMTPVHPFIQAKKGLPYEE